jgi:ubiquitin fusion degradation protein 1
MLFEARNKAQGTITHVGVLEFVAEEGRCYLPHWVSPSISTNVDDEHSPPK